MPTKWQLRGPFCFVMLDDGVRKIGRDEDVAVRDISMILVESVLN